MPRAEKTLVVLLRLSAALLMMAVVPAVMPFSWMVVIHDWLGLAGELPRTPIVGYLTRSLSAFYALHGVLVLYVSSDVRRYLPLIRCMAILCLLFGTGLIMLDWAVGLPAFWIIGEGPFVILLGTVLLWLAGQTARQAKEA